MVYAKEQATIDASMRCACVPCLSFKQLVFLPSLGGNKSIQATCCPDNHAKALAVRGPMATMQMFGTHLLSHRYRFGILVGGKGEARPNITCFGKCEWRIISIAAATAAHAPARHECIVFLKSVKGYRHLTITETSRGTQHYSRTAPYVLEPQGQCTHSPGVSVLRAT